MRRKHVRFLPLFILIIVILLTVFIPQHQQETRQYAAGIPNGYTVSGKQILDSDGGVFIPYGVQIDGILLAQPNWKYDGILTYDTYNQMLEARTFWSSNTVSLQLGSKALFAKTPYDTEYLAKVDQDIAWANQLGINILLVLQYEGAGNSYQKMPTQDSINFWDLLSKHYANNSRVFFDIFNEPNTNDLIGHYDDDSSWNFWQNGGVGVSDHVTYVGMQQLVNIIRNNGFQNLIFVDGLAAGEEIIFLPKHLLSGSNIVYAIHPYLNTTQHHTQSDWDKWFGNTATSGNFPVVADEWNQYQDQYSFSVRPCVTDAPTVVPQFLTYLRSKNIGVIGYALFPGTLIRGRNFTNPTSFDQNPETCPLETLPDLNASAQGAGQLLRNYFKTYSKVSVTPTNQPVSITPTPFVITTILPTTSIPTQSSQCPNGQTLTNLGCIPSDPIGFVAKFYGYGLGIIGGISLLVIIFRK